MELFSSGSIIESILSPVVIVGAYELVWNTDSLMVEMVEKQRIYGLPSPPMRNSCSNSSPYNVQILSSIVQRVDRRRVITRSGSQTGHAHPHRRRDA
jgi:hypothetical protein